MWRRLRTGKSKGMSWSLSVVESFSDIANTAFNFTSNITAYLTKGHFSIAISGCTQSNFDVCWRKRKLK